MTSDRERTPEEIRQDVRRTRDDMDETLEAIEYRASPTQIRQRQQRRWNQRWQRLRHRVMGAPDAGPSTGQHVQSQARHAADTARQAPDEALERTRGNPLAAGMIAFGAGALLGSLLPATDPEKQAAHNLRDRYEDDARSEAQRMARRAKDDLGESARQATEEVKQTAQDAAQTTKHDAQESAQQLRQEGQQSKDRVQER